MTHRDSRLPVKFTQTKFNSRSQIPFASVLLKGHGSNTIVFEDMSFQRNPLILPLHTYVYVHFTMMGKPH